MFNDFKLILDPPENGVYTFEDTVSGKVIFESAHEEKIGWVYIFFHGWVNVEIVMQQQPTYVGAHNNPQKWSDKSKDKEILFQDHVKVYEGYEKLHKKVRYEWPFKFSFQAETSNAYSLPTSGHYSFTSDTNWWSSVQYKVVAVHGDIGQPDHHIRWMLNPADPRYMKEPTLKPTGFLLKLREKTGGAAEQELKFMQVRTSAAVDPYMSPPRKWDLYVAAHHVPQLAPSFLYDDLKVSQTTFPFSVDLQIRQNIVVGEPFIVLLSVSSSSNIWNQNPPAVTLTSFKIQCHITDIITIGEQRGDRKIKFRTIWEGKRLQIPLSPNPVNIGRIYSFTVTGDEYIQSFDTNILHRGYDFPVELNVEVGGKSFLAKYSNTNIDVLSPNVAISELIQHKQPYNEYKADFKQKWKQQYFQEGPIKFQLQGSYIGRLTHDGAGLDRPVSEHSIMEAAIALSRTLTEAGIQHSFPGGTIIKLFPYAPDQPPDYKKGGYLGTDGENLRRLFERGFRVMEVDEPFVIALHLGFTDLKHGENLTIEFSDLQTSTEEPPEKFIESRKDNSYAMNLTPVVLFNYRLWCLATHEAFGEPEIQDIEPLFEAFKHDLRVHRREINTKFVRFALRTHPALEIILAKIGIDMSRAKGKEIQPGMMEEEDDDRGEQLPPYDPGWGFGYEQRPASGMEEVYLKGKGPAPRYEASPSTQHVWEKEEY